MPGIKNFRGKVVVITGAGSGIGRATAFAFANEGANLVLVDKFQERLDEVKKEIEQKSVRVWRKQVDVSDKAQMEALGEFVIAQAGGVDILFNNAGVTVGAKIEDMSLDDWEWVIKTNLWGTIYGIHFFLRYMIKQRYGHIVNTSSIFGLASVPGQGAYAMTKFGIVGMSEALRAEVRKYNIGVSVICPGVINTRVVVDGRMKLREGSRANKERVANLYKTRGWSPERVAKAVLKAVRKNKAVVPVGPEAWVQWFGKRISQNLYNWCLYLSERWLL